MPDRNTKKRRLDQILAAFNVTWNRRHGKGSHGCYEATIGGKYVAFPIPHGDEVSRHYISRLRRRFGLDEAGGITDQQFYDA